MLSVQTANRAVGAVFLRVRLAAVAAPAVLTYRPHIDDQPWNPTMKHLIQCTALATLLLAVGAGSAATPPATTDNSIGSEARPVTSFSKIELDVPYDITVTAQGAPAVVLSGPRKDFANIDTSVVGDTLIVRSRQHSHFSFHFGKRPPQTLIHITLPALSSVKAAGSGDVAIERYQGEQLELNLSGAGNLRAAGQSQLVKLHVAGSGDTDLRQLKTASLNLQLDGAGNVKASGITRELNAEVGGSGDFGACALSADSVSMLLRGAGNACVAGNIKKFDAEIHGSGDLTARGLQTQNARVQMSSSGNLTLSGSSAALNAEVSGSGDLDAKNLQVARAVMRGKGSGNITLSKVSDALEAEVRGSGDFSASPGGKTVKLTMSGPGQVRLDGKTDSLVAEISGSGDLDARQLLTGHAEVAVRGSASAVVNVQGTLDTTSKAGHTDHSHVVTIDRAGTHNE